MKISIIPNQGKPIIRLEPENEEEQSILFSIVLTTEEPFLLS